MKTNFLFIVISVGLFIKLPKHSHCVFRWNWLATTSYWCKLLHFYHFKETVLQWCFWFLITFVLCTNIFCALMRCSFRFFGREKSVREKRDVSKTVKSHVSVTVLTTLICTRDYSLAPPLISNFLKIIFFMWRLSINF